MKLQRCFEGEANGVRGGRPRFLREDVVEGADVATDNVD